MKLASVKKNAIMNLIYTVTNMVFPLITYPYVARILLANGMGKVSFFTSVSNYAIMMGSLGISAYGIRAIAQVRDDKHELSKVATELLILNAVITIIVVLLLGLSVPFVNKLKSEPWLLTINLVIVLATPFGLTWLYSGLEQYSYITKRNIVFKCISLALIFVFVRKESDYLLYAVLIAFSVVGSYLCNMIYSKKYIKCCISRDLKLKPHLKPMLCLFASILAVSVYTNLDTLMLGFINGDDAVGYYSVASKVKWLLLAAVNAVSAVLLPRLSYYFSNNKTKEYNETLKSSFSFILLVTIPLSVFFFLESADSIILLGGSSFEPAIICMQVLMPVLIISGFSNVTGNQILIPSGRDFCFMKAVLSGAVVDVILNALLMPSYGATGAAVATLVAEMTQMAIQFYYTKKEILNNVSAYDLTKYMIGGVIAGFAVWGIRMVVNINAFVNLVITGLVFSSIYIFVLVLMKDQYTLGMMQEIKRILRR